MKSLYSILLTAFVTKKYPAVKLPDILVSKLYFEKNAWVAF